jgi:hypothetical protein
VLTKVSERERQRERRADNERVHTEVHHCECRSVTHRYVRCALANIGVHALIIIIIMAEDAPDQVRTVRHMRRVVISSDCIMFGKQIKRHFRLETTFF